MVEARARLRDLGIVLGSLPPGPLNAITDVGGVLVGQETIIRGDGRLRPGMGPVRTGVTVIRPHPGNLFREKVLAATHVLNGAGAMVGRTLVDELGVLDTPIFLTNTLNVGLVYDAAVQACCEESPEIGITAPSIIPLVAECDDSYLNDLQGRHVRAEHVKAALSRAQGGGVEEGAVGAGTGMTCYEFKGGIGTSSRRTQRGHTVGVLVLANHGAREHLRVGGVPVGLRIPDHRPQRGGEGSIIMAVATDAPLASSQLRRLAVRATLGLARTGSTARDGSGDIAIAFSTAQQLREGADVTLRMTAEINPLFQATVEATEEAILNALTAAVTMTGRDGNTVHALPLDRLRDLVPPAH